MEKKRNIVWLILGLILQTGFANTPQDTNLENDVSKNIEIVTDYYAAVNEGNWDKVGTLLSTEATLYEAEYLPFESTYIGIDQWKEFFTTFYGLFENPEAADIKMWETEPGSVIVYMVLKAKSRETSKEINMPIMEVFTLKDDKIIEMWPYYFDTAKILEAIGHFNTSDPKIRAYGQEAFAKLSNGWVTGDYKPFTDMLAEDATYQFPAGSFRGNIKGKENLIQLYEGMNQFMQGNQIIVTKLLNITTNEDTVVYEFEDKVDFSESVKYTNKIIFSFSFNEEGKIYRYAEYIGDISPTFMNVFAEGNLPKKD